MPLSYEQIVELRELAFADDVDIDMAKMAGWTEEAVVAYFESGGVDEPVCADLASLSMCQELAPEVAASDYELESARSSVDGWVPGGRGGTSVAPTVPYADLSCTDPLGKEAEEDSGDPLGSDMAIGAEMIDDNLEAGGDERTEDALLDEDPMSSVPVTRLPAPPPAHAPNYAEAEEDDGVGSWSIRQLKEFVASHGGDASGFSEKREFIAEVRRLKAHPPAAASAPTPPPAAPTGEPSAKLARLIRKVEDIKATGDAAFRSKDFEKADRHYTSALQRAGESEEPLPPTLLSALFSNRSGSRAMANRHKEALEDGRMALRHRPGWARASSRIGAALIALHQYDEAKACYELALQSDPGSSELQTGLTDVLGRLGKSSGGSAAAAAAKQRGNDAFKAGQMEEAYAAYSEALRAAPADETLYSNRSAVLAKLERFNEALADGKRAVSLQPQWSKGYSRAGLAALKGGDEEAAYWFYSNGLKREASNAELLRGRDSTLHALRSLHTARSKRRLERFHRDAKRPPARVFAVSDVHFDHPGAKEWGQSLSKTAYKDDAIILAGDIGDTFMAVKLALRAFKAAFRRVFYVPIQSYSLTYLLTYPFFQLSNAFAASLSFLWSKRAGVYGYLDREWYEAGGAATVISMVLADIFFINPFVDGMRIFDVMIARKYTAPRALTQDQMNRAWAAHNPLYMSFRMQLVLKVIIFCFAWGYAFPILYLLMLLFLCTSIAVDHSGLLRTFRGLVTSYLLTCLLPTSYFLRLRSAAHLPRADHILGQDVHGNCHPSPPISHRSPLIPGPDDCPSH